MAIVLVIFPVDGGYIVDDVCPVLYAFLGLMFLPKDMHKLMVKPLPPGCRLTVRFLQAVTANTYPTNTLLRKALFDVGFARTLCVCFTLTLPGTVLSFWERLG